MQKPITLRGSNKQLPSTGLDVDSAGSRHRTRQIYKPSTSLRNLLGRHVHPRLCIWCFPRRDSRQVRVLSHVIAPINLGALIQLQLHHLFPSFPRTAAIYYRKRWLPLVAPYIPTNWSARMANYRPLVDQTFAQQVSAGMSSSSFDVEGQNLASGSGESRVGLDAAGVEEVRRIM